MKIDRFLAGMLLGVPLIFVGLLLTQEGYDAFFLVAGGVAALATTAVRRWQRGNEPEKDERTNKIRAVGLAYAWLVSMILVLIIFCATIMGFISIDAITALSITIYIMAGSAIVSLAVLHRRGDVDWS